MQRWWRSIDLPWSAIAISVVVAIANLGNNVVSPVLPAIQDFYGASAADVALIASGFGIGRLVMDLPAGMLTDRVSATRLFAAGIVTSGVASALAAFAGNLQQLIVFRTAMGFGSTIMSTVALVALVNISKPNQRGRALSYYTSAMLLSSAVSPMVGGYLGSLFDWRSVFIFCAVTPFISFPLNLLMTGRATRTAGSAERGKGVPGGSRTGDGAADVAERANRLNWPALIAVYLATFASFFNRWGMQGAVLPLYGGSVLRMDSVGIGAVLSSRAILTILLMLPSGALADRIGMKRLLIPGMLIAIGGNLFLLTGDSVFIFTVSAFLISMGVLANSTIPALVVDLVPERLMGRGVGWYRLLCDVGTVVGPFALGLVVDYSGFGAAMVVGSVVLAAGTISCGFLVPNRVVRIPERRRSGSEIPAN